MEPKQQHPIYLVAELAVSDPEKLTEYAAKVQPVMRRYGGRIIAVSQPHVRVIEGDWQPDLLVIHRWQDSQHFDEFWNSAEYAPLKELRHQACDSRIVLLDALPDGHPR